MDTYAEVVEPVTEYLEFDVCNDENCTRCVLIKQILSLKQERDVVLLNQ